MEILQEKLDDSGGRLYHKYTVGIFNKSKQHRDFVMDPGFAVNVSDMGFNRAMFNIQGISDLFIIKALADHLGDLEFSGGHVISFF